MRNLKTLGGFLMLTIAGLGVLNVAGCPTETDAVQAEQEVREQPVPTPAPAPTPPPAPVPQPPVPPAAITPVLFVANNAGGITSFANPVTLNGNIAPTTNLAGPQTQLTLPAGVAVNATGALMTVTNIPATVLFYDAATSTNGNLAPNRNISGAATLLGQSAALSWDESTDYLFVSNITLVPGSNGSIAVFGAASNPLSRGNLAPLHRITSPNINGPVALAQAKAGDLYVGNNGAANIAVFARAANVNGTVAADRMISSPAFAGTTLLDVFVNSADQLFVTSTGNRVYVFNNASTRNGAVMPDSVLTVSGATSVRAVAVDKNGVGYVSDDVRQAIYQFDGLAGRNGTFAPDRTIMGSNTQLNRPGDLFIRE